MMKIFNSIPEGEEITESTYENLSNNKGEE